MRTYWKELTISTGDNNLPTLDPKLKQFVGPQDIFFIEDLTEQFQQLVAESKITDGLFTAQVMHTTTVLSVNELDEPMLLMDIHRALSEIAPRVNDYLHNSPLRTKNRCAEDNRCDRNADAHVKSFLIGNATTSLLVRDGKLLLGRWQRISVIDFDGPRQRRLVVQILGE